MSDDAIENIDVSAEDQQDGADIQEQDSTPRGDRLSALNDIAKQHNDLHGIKNEEDEDPAIPDEEESQEAGEESLDGAENITDETEAQAAAPDDPLKDLGYYQKPDGQLYTRMKINGEEKEVPASQVKAHLQKDIAGDHKLQQAWEREQQLRQREARLDEMEARMRQPQPSSKDVADYQKDAETIMNAMWDGGSDESKEQLAEVLQRLGNGQPTVNQDELVNSVMSQVEQREAQREQARKEQEWNASIQKGREQMQEQYQHLLEDESLFHFVDGETYRILQEQEKGNPDFIDLTPDQIILRAAETVNERIGSPSPSVAATSSRQRNKQGLKPIPRSRSKVQSQEKREIDMSPAAVIARMKGSRAGAT